MPHRWPHAVALVSVAVVLFGCSASRATPTASPAHAGGTTGAIPTATAAATGGTRPAACQPRRSMPASTAPQTIVSAGQTRQFLLSLPHGYDASAAAPLLLDFHGSGSNMVGQSAYTDLPARGAAAGFIVVTPDGTGDPKGWNLLPTASGNDFTFAHDLIGWAEGHLCVDPTRVDAAGISLGSEFASLLACQPPDLIAAIGLVASEAPPTCPTEVHVSVIAFHGTADPVVPFSGGPVPSSGRGDRSYAPSAEATVAAWAAHDGCRAAATTTPAPDVRLERWADCTSPAAVELYAIVGGGHTWPGGPDAATVPALARLGPVTRSISATDLMLAFFRDHPGPT
jgi:polyhydroxybutyrate depolymerase